MRSKIVFENFVKFSDSVVRETILVYLYVLEDT